MYKVQITKSALKELSKLPLKEALKVTRRINDLKDDPRPNGCVKLTGSINEYRIRLEIIELCTLLKTRFY